MRPSHSMRGMLFTMVLKSVSSEFIYGLYYVGCPFGGDSR